MTKMILSDERKQLLQDMPPALRKKIEQLQRLHNESEQVNLAKRYEFSQILSEIQKDPKTYGNAGMDHIAMWFGMGVRNLYYFVSVYTTIDPKSFDKLKDKVDKNGYKFTWSHLKSLVMLDKAADRNKMVKIWEQESLSVVDFHKRVQELIDAADPNKGGEEAPPSRASEVTVRALLKQVTGVEQRMEEVEQADLSEFLIVDKKRELLEKLLAECSNLETRVSHLRRRIRDLQEDSPTEATMDTTLAENEEPEEVEDLLDGISADSDDDTTMQSVVDNALRTPPPVKNTGRKRKNGKPGSKAAVAAEAKAAKAKSVTKASSKKPTPTAAKSAKAGPAARRRRGEVVTA